MKWNNLKENKCPKCNKFLTWTDGNMKRFECICTFSISEQRFKEIVNSQVNKSLQKSEEELLQEEENL